MGKTRRRLAFDRGFRAGDWVEVRSADEILATLDEVGALETLPFMPEMLRHCGRRYRVSKRAHKTCDTIEKSGGRRMRSAVHLEDLRCDGSDHGGCQARCLLFWKEAWLRRAPEPGGEARPTLPSEAHERLLAHTRSQDSEGRTRYVCQATQLLRASSPLPPWNLLQYLRDLWYRNVGPGEFLRVTAIALFNWFQRIRGGAAYPMVRPSVTGKTPRVMLDLRPGELVRIRSKEEIEATLDQSGKNRGLWFDVEMVEYCGSTHRVLDRVAKIIDEKSGHMIRLPNDCILLEGVTCRARLSRGRLFCPRAIPSYWREIWLERVGPRMGAADPSREPGASRMPEDHCAASGGREFCST